MIMAISNIMAFLLKLGLYLHKLMQWPLRVSQKELYACQAIAVLHNLFCLFAFSLGLLPRC